MSVHVRSSLTLGGNVVCVDAVDYAHLVQLLEGYRREVDKALTEARHRAGMEELHPPTWATPEGLKDLAFRVVIEDSEGNRTATVLLAPGEEMAFEALPREQPRRKS